MTNARKTPEESQRQGGDAVQTLFAETVDVLRTAVADGVPGAQAALDKLVKPAGGERK